MNPLLKYQLVHVVIYAILLVNDYSFKKFVKTEANYGTVLGTLIVYRMLPWQPFLDKRFKKSLPW